MARHFEAADDGAALLESRLVGDHILPADVVIADEGADRRAQLYRARDVPAADVY